MSYHVEDTIAAIASAPGGAMRGIIRVSGPDTLKSISNRFRPDADVDLAAIRSAQSVPGRFDAQHLGQFPCDLYLWPTNRSYTRQPSAEIHTIGSPPLLEATLQTICSAGARLAEPGEFTMRAFLAGRLDLTQAEAVLGVIDAADREELDVALTQLAGGLAAPLNQLRDRLLDLLAHLEAGLDFVEEDIEFISADQLCSQLAEAQTHVEEIAAQLCERGETAGEFRVVLVGAANVGKSSLLNALADDHAAIVSDIAGTTRDYVSRKLEMNGLSCLLIDTAGVDSGMQDGVESAAQSMTHEQAKQADVRLFCIDATRPMTDWERQNAPVSPSATIPVLTKVDLPRRAEVVTDAIETSSKTGLGVDKLRETIKNRLLESSRRAGQVVGGTAMRCRESVRLAADALHRAQELAEHEIGEELVAVEVRTALDELGKVVGAVYTDDVLDRVFSRFCIGK